MDWLKKLIGDYEAGRLKVGLGIHHVKVLHDNECPQLHDKGSCNCEPEVEPMKDEDFH